MSNLCTAAIGYLGDIREMDIALLEFLATSRPDWEFVLIGPLPADLLWQTRLLQGLENVRFVGARQYEQLRSYLKLLDMCLVPYAKNSGDGTGPGPRLNEYLAVGRPNFTGGAGKSPQSASIARVVRTPGEFLEAIDLFLVDYCPCEIRITLVDDDSWSSPLLKLAKGSSNRSTRPLEPKIRALPARAVEVCEASVQEYAPVT